MNLKNSVSATLITPETKLKMTENAKIKISEVFPIIVFQEFLENYKKLRESEDAVQNCAKLQKISIFLDTRA